MKIVAFIAPFFLAGCASPVETIVIEPPLPVNSSANEPVAVIRTLPKSLNEIDFSVSIASLVSDDAVIAAVDPIVNGRLPGWRFKVVSYSIAIPPTQAPDGKGGVETVVGAVSYRDFGTKTIVLSWWPRGAMNNKKLLALNCGSFGCGDVAWEVTRAVMWVDDFGKPALPPRW